MASAEMASRIWQWFPLLPWLILSFLPFQAKLSSASDTLSFGQSLSGNQTITSSSGDFELGFLSPGNSSNYHYVGIWLKNDPGRAKVWVANRDSPLYQIFSSELKISEEGELVLLDNSKTPVWSSSSSRSPSKTSKPRVAVLLDTGNLVLRDASEPSDVLWQSFDEPTDTLLAGARVGYNRTTGKSWTLTSWKNLEDPSLGMFSLEMDPSGVTQFLLLRNRTRQYWNTGPWDGDIFANVPQMRIKDEFSYVNFSSDGANYFLYTDSDETVITIMRVDVAGKLVWQQMLKDTKEWLVFASLPVDPCDVYTLCGPFASCKNSGLASCECLPAFNPRSLTDWRLGDQSGGCRRKAELLCGSNSSKAGDGDGFLMIPRVKLPINSRTVHAQSAEECAAVCLNNCLCTAYSYDSQCSLWDGDLLSIKQIPSSGNGGSVGALYVRVAASDLPVSRGKKRTAEAAVLGAVIGTVMLCAAATSVVLWMRRRRRSMGSSDLSEGFVVPFRYKHLQRATRNFSQKLGKGGFGSVYKGTLPDASVVAVKKIEHLGQGEKQLRMEVRTLAAVQHVNVVRLRGFCCEGMNRLLVYDCMPNGSLDSYLFPKCSKPLDWSTRYRIATGTARGLAYLHERCRECIIHCDIKPENILLDEDFSPKVADFGMAKLIGRDFSRVLTTMRGTIGYVAPEWISGVPITPKADVFSFGMMFFEVISGRRNGTASEDGAVSFFPSWAARNVNEVEDLELIGDGVKGDVNIEEFTRSCRIACWCIQENEDDRPTMGQVVQMLEGTLEVKMAPIPEPWG